MAPVVNMLWIGSQLSYIEQLAIRSFIDAGHQVCLHVYDEIGDVPQGTVVVDGNETVAADYLLTLKYRHNGSYALAGNYFRLALQQQGKGIWVDADMVCIRAFPDDPYLFGWQDNRLINNAVLRLPAEGPTVAAGLAAFRPNFIPPWQDLNRRRQLWMKRLAGIGFGPQDHSWAALGPQALTALLRSHDLLHQAQPVSAFYPVPYADCLVPFSPGESLDPWLRQSTYGLHLWHAGLKDYRTRRPAGSSMVGQLLRKHGV